MTVCVDSGVLFNAFRALGSWELRGMVVAGWGKCGRVSIVACLIIGESCGCVGHVCGACLGRFGWVGRVVRVGVG